MTQPDQPNDTGAQQFAEAQQSAAEQLQQKAEEVLAAVTPQAASAAAAAQKHLGKVQAWAAGLTKMVPASIRKPLVGASALCAVLVLVATLLFFGGNSPEGGNLPYVSPEEVATAYVTAVSKGEFDKALALVHFPEGEKEAALGALREGKKEVDDKGGMERLEVVTNLETVLSEIVRDNNPDRARVVLRAHFKNGQQDQSGVDLIRVNGKWMVGSE